MLPRVMFPEAWSLDKQHLRVPNVDSGPMQTDRIRHSEWVSPGCSPHTWHTGLGEPLAQRLEDTGLGEDMPHPPEPTAVVSSDFYCYQ